MKDKKGYIQLITSMCIFGTIGIFRRYIPLPSGLIAAARGLLGAIAILLFLLCQRKFPAIAAIRRKLPLLLLAGACLGGNWVLLFEAYNHTSVAVATVCYYMAPIFAMLAATLFYKEHLTLKKGLCAVISCIGIVLISGTPSGGANNPLGIAYGLGAAVLYATVMLLGRKLTDVDPYDRTLVQLLVSAIAVGTYSLFAEELTALPWNGVTIGLLILVGVLHTGVAYTLYFGSMNSLSTQTVALFSYIDPVVSIVLSTCVLFEPLTAWAVVGILLVLGSTVVSEWTSLKKQ